MVLLAPVWCATATGVQATETPTEVVLARAPGPVTTPLVRRPTVAGWWVYGNRADHGRGLVALAIVAVLSVLALVPWGRLAAVCSPRSSLVRRRHVIALRAPPSPLCA
ncbi:MAG: hypothetical protein QOE93_1174 [Actinomycetota bacterium]|nr:hypothetical protein [Actinomycetota bacterium]